MSLEALHNAMTILWEGMTACIGTPVAACAQQWLDLAQEHQRRTSSFWKTIATRWRPTRILSTSVPTGATRASRIALKVYAPRNWAENVPSIGGWVRVLKIECVPRLIGYPNDRLASAKSNFER